MLGFFFDLWLIVYSLSFTICIFLINPGNILTPRDPKIKFDDPEPEVKQDSQAATTAEDSAVPESKVGQGPGGASTAGDSSAPASKSADGASTGSHPQVLQWYPLNSLLQSFDHGASILNNI